MVSRASTTSFGLPEAIVATGLTKWFGDGETRMTAVDRVGLTAHFGEMLFIIGPPGSGKTTLLSMISGLLRPNAGKVIAKVVGNGLTGVPTLYTTYNRAKEYLPTTRFTISYVLVQTNSPLAVAGIEQQVAKLGYIALIKDEFNQRISDYYTYKTGIGTNILLMTVISFIVGLSISGQTFYTFILENLEKIGALKAIGAKGRELSYMIHSWRPSPP